MNAPVGLLTPADFHGLDQPLIAEYGSGASSGELGLAVESVSLQPSHRHREEPFSLVLTGPPSPVLPQGTYRIRHPVRGVLELFVVPIARDASAARYEVVFN